MAEVGSVRRRVAFVILVILLIVVATVVGYYIGYEACKDDLRRSLAEAFSGVGR